MGLFTLRIWQQIVLPIPIIWSWKIWKYCISPWVSLWNLWIVLEAPLPRPTGTIIFTWRLGTCHLDCWTAPAISNPWMDTGRWPPGFVLRNVPEWSLTLHQLHRHLLCGTPQPGITRLPKKATTTRRRRPGMHGISASSASIFMWPGWQQALSLMGPVFTHRSHSFAACLQAKFVEHRWTGKSELTGLGE